MINLATLNVHYSIPVFSRAGRSMSFSYGLSVDSTAYTKLSTTYFYWGPSWPVTSGVGPAAGVVYYRVSSYYCSTLFEYGQQYTAYSYVDPGGTSHPISVTVWDLNQDTGPCPIGNRPLKATVLAADGSGLITFDVTNRRNNPIAIISLANGTVVTPVVLSSSHITPATSYTQTDANGNRITVTPTSSGSQSLSSVVDTLGTAVLTSSGTAPSPVYYSYQAPSGGQASVVMSYRSYNVQVKFQCTGVTDLGPAAYSLLDRITLPDGSYYQFTYETTPGAYPNVTGRIASVRLPTGGTISYTYAGGDTGAGILCADGSTAEFYRSTPDGTWHYVRVKGSGASSTTTVTDPQGNVTVINFSNNYETQRQVYQGAATGTPLETVITCYNGNASSCPTPASPVVPPFTEIKRYRQLNGGPQAVVDEFYNSNRLLAETDEYDFGAATPTRKTVITYDTTLGNNVVNHPSVVTVTDGNNNLQSKITYIYDEDVGSLQASGAPQLFPPSCSAPSGKCRGNVTTASSYVTSTTALTRHFTHYDTGQVATATDVNGAVTSYTYGACGSSFLTSVSMPLSLTQSRTWNCSGGVMASATDENGQPSYTNYTTDPYFWRPESAQDALANVTSFSYLSPTQVESSMPFSGGNSVSDVLAVADSLGRAHLTQRRQAPGAGTFDTSETDYNSLGRPSRATLPFAASAGQGSPTAPGVSSTYDALGRVITVTDSGGGTRTYTYSQNDVLVSAGPAPAGEHVKQRQYEYDSLGRLTSVCEVTSLPGSGACGQSNPVTGYWTKYTYDALGDLTGVTQNAQGASQTRSYTYDDLGRLTSETNPESGTMTYVYDTAGPNNCFGTTSNGDLILTVDARGANTCRYYDVLHRLTDVGTTGPVAGSCMRFRYDNSSGVLGSKPAGVLSNNSLGRLAEAETDTCAAWPITPSSIITDEWFSYSPRGEVTDVYQSTPHSGQYYHVAAQYLANGGLNTLSVPGVPTITYLPDGEGRPSVVNAASGQSPVTSTTYNAASLPAQVNLGSGDSDVFGYDTNTDRQISYTFNVGSSQVVGGVTWNANGTLSGLSITDQFNSADSQTCAYSHDDLARITNANCGSVWSQTFGFDPFGNITKSGSQSFQPIYSAATNRMATLPGFTPTYDASGNLLNDSFHSYTWDAVGHLVSVDSLTVTYDALGRAVEQGQAGAYTQVVYAPWGTKIALMNGPALAKAFIPLTTGATAVYNAGGLAYYRHPDWLGSSRLATTPSRTVYSDTAYAPYGESYAAYGTTDPNFTGQNQDTAPGLHDFLYREHHPVSGRWISPDPAGLGAASLADPQSWNRYAYVGDRPLENTDPSGLVVGDCSYNCSPHKLWSLGQDWNEFDLLNIPVVVHTFTPPQPISTPIWSINNQYGYAVSATIYVPAGWTDVEVGNGGSLLEGGVWTWNFAKSFVKFAGGPGNVPTCAGQAILQMGDTLNPLSPEPGVGTLGDVAATAAQATALNRGVAATQAGIDAYVAARGLTVPLRSSVVRAMAAEGAEGAVAAGARANLAVQTLVVDYAAIKSGYLTSQQALSGGCAAAFPIF